MMSIPTIPELMKYTDRNLIETLLSSYYIVDYGYINKVNADKTVNVTHAKKQSTMDGETLPETVTKNIEVLTLSSAGLALQFDYKANDKVLLLGLKDYVQNTADVSKATDQDVFIHYDRSTLKAVPLAAFDDNAKVTIKVENGTMKIDADTKIELNGNTKQFVTWTELNTALSTFLTQLTLAMTTTPIVGNGSTQPSWVGLPTQIDISAAKTSTIVTGG